MSTPRRAIIPAGARRRVAVTPTPSAGPVPTDGSNPVPTGSVGSFGGFSFNFCPDAPSARASAARAVAEASAPCGPFYMPGSFSGAAFTASPAFSSLTAKSVASNLLPESAPGTEVGAGKKCPDAEKDADDSVPLFSFSKRGAPHAPARHPKSCVPIGTVPAHFTRLSSVTPRVVTRTQPGNVLSSALSGTYIVFAPSIPQSKAGKKKAKSKAKAKTKANAKKCATAVKNDDCISSTMPGAVPVASVGAQSWSTVSPLLPSWLLGIESMPPSPSHLPPPPDLTVDPESRLLSATNPTATPRTVTVGVRWPLVALDADFKPLRGSAVLRQLTEPGDDVYVDNDDGCEGRKGPVWDSVTTFAVTVPPNSVVDLCFLFQADDSSKRLPDVPTVSQLLQSLPVPPPAPAPVAPIAPASAACARAVSAGRPTPAASGWFTGGSVLPPLLPTALHAHSDSPLPEPLLEKCLRSHVAPLPASPPASGGVWPRPHSCASLSAPLPAPTSTPTLSSLLDDAAALSAPNSRRCLPLLPLPLPPGAYRVTQGPGGALTHAASETAHAVDVRAPPGTPVLAPWKCTVVSVVSTHSAEADKCGGKRGEKREDERNPVCGSGSWVGNLWEWQSVLLRVNACDAAFLIDGDDAESSSFTLPPFFVELVHLSSVRVRAGDALPAGALLGLTGGAGFCPEPHLHIQVQASDADDAPTFPFAFMPRGRPECSFVAAAGDLLCAERGLLAPEEGVAALRVAAAVAEGFAGDSTFSSSAAAGLPEVTVSRGVSEAAADDAAADAAAAEAEQETEGWDTEESLAAVSTAAAATAGKGGMSSARAWAHARMQQAPPRWLAAHPNAPGVGHWVCALIAAYAAPGGKTEAK